MAETELERAEKRYAQAKARLQALKNREATRQRKLDTRRKVILGGALLDLAERDSGAAARSRSAPPRITLRLVSSLRCLVASRFFSA